MPELPEVETIVRDLDKKLKNKKLVAIDSRDKKVFQLSRKELKNLLGKKVIAVRRRAKMIVFDFGGYYLIIHLKMTGQLVLKTKTGWLAGGHPILNKSGGLPNKFSRVIFKFNDGSRLFFNDIRRFGWIKLIDKDEFLKFNLGLGIEPLSSDFTLEYFKQVLERRKRIKIKQALLEQKYLAGIGNIYADESLYAARLRPFRRVRTLKPAEIKRLWLTIPRILTLAIKHRGTSFSDYVDARGEQGNFIKYLKVYGRAGEKCGNCGGFVKKIKLAGRGTHWCDSCQK
ncbi:MAG: bifunctional DNA-formamidopyrimidine glycosylase/DNA-(apurinic or apyrimidinic site) lyase [bacterium]|nr:bifunctional DNA-formamidopyrimidine glycosylase/DNA-(apurinic or apyrimidinic site) lyase [bacterium]